MSNADNLGLGVPSSLARCSASHVRVRIAKSAFRGGFERGRPPAFESEPTACNKIAGSSRPVRKFHNVYRDSRKEFVDPPAHNLLQLVDLDRQVANRQIVRHHLLTEIPSFRSCPCELRFQLRLSQLLHFRFLTLPLCGPLQDLLWHAFRKVNSVQTPSRH